MSTFDQIKANRNYRTALIIFIVLSLWMASGMLINSSENEQAPADVEAKPLYVVRAKLVHAQPYAAQLHISSRTEPNRAVNVRAELAGQVVGLPVEKGKIVKTGEVICELAVEDRPLRLEQAKAEVNKAKLEYDAALRLESSGYQALTVIAEKKTLLETARANLKRSELDLQQLKIRAPFDGVVDERPVDIGDLMQRGDVCAKVLDFDPLLVVGQVAGNNISRIKTGDAVQVHLLTGENVDGVVRFISSNSDNLTRTFRLEVAVPNSNNVLHSGITAEIVFFAAPIQAHIISPSLLSLDDAGKIGVRIVNEQAQVNFINVSLLGDAADGVWVAGLPESAIVITVGHEYVSEGQTVEIAAESQAVTGSAARSTPEATASQP
jgi:multidrug efflux system membrane fusion protein